MAEVNEVYHKYSRYPTSWILDTQTQTAKLQSSIQGRPRKPEIIYTPVQQLQTSEHHSSKPSLHFQRYYTKRQCKLYTRNIQHGSTILHIPTGTIQPTAKSIIHSKSTVPQQLVRGQTKQPDITVRHNNTHQEITTAAINTQKHSSPSKRSTVENTTNRYYVGSQSCRRTTYHTGGSVQVTNHWRYPGVDTDNNEPRMPPNNTR